jgi:hypothetical protein
MIISIELSLELHSVNNVRVTICPIQVIKYSLHLKLTTSDLFRYVKLNQYTKLLNI